MYRANYSWFNLILSCSNSQSLINIADSQPAVVNSENATVAVLVYDLLSLSNCCAREYNVMTTHLFYRDVYQYTCVDEGINYCYTEADNNGDTNNSDIQK